MSQSVILENDKYRIWNLKLMLNRRVCENYSRAIPRNWASGYTIGISYVILPIVNRSVFITDEKLNTARNYHVASLVEIVLWNRDFNPSKMAGRAMVPCTSSGNFYKWHANACFHFRDDLIFKLSANENWISLIAGRWRVAKATYKCLLEKSFW